METHIRRREEGFRYLFVLVTVTILLVPYIALGAGPAFRSSGSSRLGSRGQHFVSHGFHRFGFLGGDGLDDQDVTITQQAQPAPSTEPKPAENRIYVPPHWVDGGYGVQVLQPSYWTVPKEAPKH